MKILNKVTVTGADDSINPERLVEIQARYPFVEFGILLSRNQQGASRFPSDTWLKWLVEVFEKNPNPLNLSGHICGQWVAGFLTGHMVDLDQITPGLSEVFSRFQINTHAQPHEHSVEMYDILSHLSNQNKTVIFQLDGRDGTKIAKEAVANGWQENIAGLFDLSHGAGRLPSNWPYPINGLSCGYAGGLSPENVADQLRSIEVTSNGMTWIDAETHLFTPEGFSLDRVQAFLEASKPWVK